MRQSKYTKELLAPIVADSTTYSQIIEKLGLKLTGGNYQMVKGHIKRHNLDSSHFTGQAWSKGRTVETDDRIRRTGLSDEQVFVKNGPVIGGDKLRPRMLRNGFEYKCISCGNNGNWLGKSMILHIDHIDGDHNNNEKENLRFLCPNCHQITETWGNNGR